ncbi:hypothetical protein KJ644_04365 [Candidatus Dependentiae bacterium]|nr:hypothetical protein [Candidatus Dependentiae bacterium]MBU4387673.1 hypothetical protein [Candidatus Dependentiae bacterium]MCG2756060.1 hypothetical protein [Candidatus Dependentiae bacterium]
MKKYVYIFSLILSVSFNVNAMLKEDDDSSSSYDSTSSDDSENSTKIENLLKNISIIDIKDLAEKAVVSLKNQNYTDCIELLLDIISQQANEIKELKRELSKTYKASQYFLNNILDDCDRGYPSRY